jgi:glycosyltransferase involved in cell wall biosynthesis
VLQIGAREHYAIARALHQLGNLQALLTDCWMPPTSLITRLPRTKRLAGRWHSELEYATVLSPSHGTLLHEVRSRLNPFVRHGRSTHARNQHFQIWASRTLAEITPAPRSIFSYSYAALKPFQIAEAQGCHKILGQIDCGPAEDQVVAEEQLRYPHLLTSWSPEPSSYWDQWHREISLAEHIVVNSSWSYDCMIKEGVPKHKLIILPLVYQPDPQAGKITSRKPQHSSDVFRLLYLGTIGLRKGIARLLDAMRILHGQPVVLTMAGPSELDPTIWAGFSNVHWIGPLPRTTVSAAYASADAMILPSLSDGFAITQLESLANQTPVIASRNCGKVVEHGVNGWLLANLEPETIAATILEAIETHGQLPRPLLLPSFGIGDLGQTLNSLLTSNSDTFNEMTS